MASCRQIRTGVSTGAVGREGSSPRSSVFTSVSVGSSPRSLFTSANRSNRCSHCTKYCTRTIRYVTLRFRDRRGAASLRHRSRAAIRDLSEISRGRGGWKQREGHNFLRPRKGRGHEKWAIKRGRVMQIHARDHVEVQLQKKKKDLSFTSEKSLGEIGELSDQLS